jgi:chaperonin GroES
MFNVRKMLGDRILIKRDEAQDKTPGGIILPDTAKHNAMSGVVLAVGPGRMLDNGNLEPMEILEGDTVAFAKYSGSDTAELLGKDTIIMSQRDILAVLEPGDSRKRKA